MASRNGRKRRQHGEGSFYQRSSDGLWIAVTDLGWKDGRRDRRTFSAKSLDEAIEKRAKFLDRRRDGFTLPKGRQPYVSEWMTHWLWNIAKPNIEATTFQRSYRQKTEDLICPFFERIPLPELDEELIESWHRHLERKVSERTGRPLSASTIAQAHRILSSALKVAVVRGRVIRNVAANVTPPKPKRKRQPVPTKKQAAAILHCCTSWPTGPRWILALTTGARQGELLGLCWDRVHLEEDPAVRIEQELARLAWEHGCADPHGCGASRHRDPCPPGCAKAARKSGRKHHCRKAADKGLCKPDCAKHASSCPQREGGLVLKDVKSEAAHRWLPLGILGLAALRKQWEWQMADRLAGGDRWGWTADLVFTGHMGAPLDPPRDWDDWCALLDECGLPHFTVHSARHAVATVLLEEGTDIKIVQELLGHASASFTRDFYQHVRMPMKRDAAAVLDRAFGAE
jgi:integrase